MQHLQIWLGWNEYMSPALFLSTCKGNISLNCIHNLSLLWFTEHYIGTYLLSHHSLLCLLLNQSHSSERPGMLYFRNRMSQHQIPGVVWYLLYLSTRNILSGLFPVIQFVVPPWQWDWDSIHPVMRSFTFLWCSERFTSFVTWGGSHSLEDWVTHQTPGQQEQSTGLLSSCW